MSTRFEAQLEKAGVEDLNTVFELDEAVATYCSAKQDLISQMIMVQKAAADLEQQLRDDAHTPEPDFKSTRMARSLQRKEDATRRVLRLAREIEATGSPDLDPQSLLAGEVKVR